MKIRSLLYGYQYQDGQIVVHLQEKATVERIFKSYLEGTSLLRIAEKLNWEQVEYMPGIINWNKARLMRLLEDERYLGTETYPPIIDNALLESVSLLKAKKSTQKHIDRKANIFNLGVPVLCSSCGNPMRRRYNCQRTPPERWYCQNEECKKTIAISDDELLSSLTKLLNMLIDNPNAIKDSPHKNRKPCIEILRLENEIGQMLEDINPNKDVLKQKMLTCLSLKYKEIDSAPYVTKHLKADFEKSSPLSAFSAELFKRTVKAVIFTANEKVCLILMNDQQIQEE